MQVAGGYLGTQQREVQQRDATLRRQLAAVTANRSAAGQVSLHAGLCSLLLQCLALLSICSMVSSLRSCCTQFIALHCLSSWP